MKEYKQYLREIDSAFEMMGLGKGFDMGGIMKKKNDSIARIIRGKYKLDSLETVFSEQFGEDEYNILKLKIEDDR